MEECPRCGRPLDRFRALSRTCDEDDVDEVYVCASCGGDEAMEQAAGRLAPRADWPVRR
jgi:hypothetical protein